MKAIIMSMTFLLLLSGCSATKKDMIPMGGSKADGTVRMGYDYGMFESPKVDILQAETLAAKKCKTWGYDGAEAFGGQNSICAQPGPYGCEKTNVSVEFQCIGGKASQN